MLYYVGLYVAVHIATFLFYRYYMLKDIFATKDDPVLIKKYPLFQRNDIQTLGVIRSFPFYITYWPRFIIGQCVIIGGSGLAVLCTIGVKDTTKTTGPRYAIIKATIRFVSRSSLYLFGYFWIEIKKDEKMCYKKYLGPDWKPVWSGAPTYVQNHTSIADGFLGVLTLFPSYVARENVRDIAGIGTLMAIM